MPACSQRQRTQDGSLNLGLNVCLCVEVEGRESHFTTGKEARIAGDPEHAGGSVLHLALLAKLSWVISQAQPLRGFFIDP